MWLDTVYDLKEILNAHLEQARRFIQSLIISRSPRTLKAEALKLNTKVYCFDKRGKRGEWKHGYIRQDLYKVVLVSSNIRGTGRNLKIAYEDIRLVPKSNLLVDLYKIEEPLSAFEKQRLQEIGLTQKQFKTLIQKKN